MELDLTRGSVLKNVVRFSLPYLLSYFLQTLYGMADLFIIGQYAGVEATTAVSVGSQVMHMLTVMIVGLAMGTTVSIAQSVGAKDRARTAVGTDRTDRKRALPPVLDWADTAHYGLQRVGTEPVRARPLPGQPSASTGTVCASACVHRCARSDPGGLFPRDHNDRLRPDQRP